VAKLRRLRTQFDAGLPMPDDRLTVAGYLERWLATTLPSQVGPSTRDDYEDIVRLHLLPGLGRKKLSQLTPADVNAVWESKREKYAASSIRKMRAVLRSALSDAERASLVARNVAALSTAPRLDSDEGRSLSLKQARSLLDSVSGDRLEAPVTLMLAFGLRRGETLGVRWSDVDWDEHTLHLVKSVKRVRTRSGPNKTQLVLGDLKTRRSRRSLHLSPELVDTLRRHRARQAQERLAAGPMWQDSGMAFPSEVGTLMDPDNFARAFSRICRAAGLGHWNPHAMRHSCASIMLAQGTPLHVVSEVLGHASIAITKDVYGHLVDGEKTKAIQTITGALFGEPGSQFGSRAASEADPGANGTDA